LYIDNMQKSLFRWAGAVAVVAAMPALAVNIEENPSKTPYQGIVDRNVFGLRPPPPPPDPEANKPPPPKITLTGITTILGNARALMKTPPPPAGKGSEAPKGDQYYTLSVGERQGDIEVLEIDTTGGSVKVNNAGTVVTLTFDKDGAKGGGGGGVPAPPGAVPPPMPGAGGFGAAPAAGGPTGFSMPTRTVRAGGGFGQPAGTDASGGGGVQPTGFNGQPIGNTGLPLAGASAANAGVNNQAALDAAAQRSAEENVLLYEANRLKNQGTGLPRMPRHITLGPDQTGNQQQPPPQNPGLPYPPGIQGGPRQ
jgi:hypothetical protein